MEPRSLPFALLLQSLGLVAAVGLAVFGPQPGRASQLVPIIGTAGPQASARQSARWAASEDAQLLAFDRDRGRATVIAPSATSLMRALAYGLIPIAADIPSCTVTTDDRTIESSIT